MIIAVMNAISAIAYRTLKKSGLQLHPVEVLAPVVQTMDSTIQRIVIYPVDSAIHRLNNRGLTFSGFSTQLLK